MQETGGGGRGEEDVVAGVVFDDKGSLPLGSLLSHSRSSRIVFLFLRLSLSIGDRLATSVCLCIRLLLISNARKEQGPCRVVYTVRIG